MSLSLRILSQEEAQKHIARISDIAYSGGFFSFQERYYGLRSEYAALCRGGELVAVIPVNYGKDEAFSVHKDYTVPLVLTENAIDWQEVVKLLRERYSVRSAQLYFAGVAGKKTALSTFVLKIPDGMAHDEIRMRYDKKTRNEVRKGEKAGFALRSGGAELLDDFHLLYKENMERHGSGAKARNYFEDLFSSFGKECAIIAAYDRDVLAGANLILRHNAYLRLSFNISKTSYWEKCVNNVLYDRMIAHWYDRGVRIFDFGPSLNKDASHNKFKIGFGAQQVPLAEFSSASHVHRVKKWLAQKRHSLKIRVRKLKKRI